MLQQQFQSGTSMGKAHSLINDVAAVLVLGAEKGKEPCLITGLLHGTCDGGHLIHEILLSSGGGCGSNSFSFRECGCSAPPANP